MTHEAFINALTNFSRLRMHWKADPLAEQIRAWWPAFQHIDVGICEDELAREVTAQYVNIRNVLARCRVRQDEAREPEPRPEPPDIDPAVWQVQTRSWRLILDGHLTPEAALELAQRTIAEGLSYDAALDAAREEVRDDA